MNCPLMFGIVVASPTTYTTFFGTVSHLPEFTLETLKVLAALLGLEMDEGSADQILVGRTRCYAETQLVSRG